MTGANKGLGRETVRRLAGPGVVAWRHDAWVGEANVPARLVFSGLSALVVDGVVDECWWFAARAGPAPRRWAHDAAHAAAAGPCGSANWPGASTPNRAPRTA